MIFWLIMVGAVIYAAVVYLVTKDKFNSFGAPAIVVSVSIIILATITTGAANSRVVLDDPSLTTVTEVSEVTYTLAPNSSISDRDELEFVYVGADGTSKPLSVPVDTVEYTGGTDEITIYERDYSYGTFWVPWGSGAVLTEAVVR